MDRGATECVLRRELQGDDRVRWAYVFGSFARGEPYRDLDIAIMLEPDAKWSALELGRLQLHLERATGHPVDVVELGQAALPLIGSVLRERRLLVDRATDERHEWEAVMASRWLDFEPARLRQSALRREAMRRREGSAG